MVILVLNEKKIKSEHNNSIELLIMIYGGMKKIKDNYLSFPEVNIAVAKTGEEDLDPNLHFLRRSHLYFLYC